MTPESRIQAIIEILDNILNEERPADGIVSYYYRNRRFIGSKDRAYINHKLYNLMRRYYRLSWHLEQCGHKPINSRALIMADMAFENVSDRDFDEIFSIERNYGPTRLTKPDLHIIDSLRGTKMHPDNMPEKISVECPDWACDLLQRSLGDGFSEELRAMMVPASLDLRVNTLKADRDFVFKKLKKDGIKLEEDHISPWGIRVIGRPHLSQHPLFIDGAIEVQDQGSQLVALVADPKPGDRVVDFCAGAGGKTLALGAMMENKGKIVATDVLEKRLTRAKQRFRRASLHNVEIRPLETENDKWVKRHKRSFDIVVVDAPCSGTGTWRRDPDKRFKQLGPDLDTLLDLQYRILKSAHRLVRPGGRLVYATCSLLMDENEDQITKFLEEQPDFSVVPISEIWADSPSNDPYLQLTPSQHKTDGFFAAVLVRKEEEKKEKEVKKEIKETKEA